jgi:adenosylcobinamide-GDP ribazoletransferase
VGALGAWLAPALAVLVAVTALGVTGAVATVAGLGAALVFGRFMAGRLGGLTGDVFGAAVEIAELATLLAVIAWIGARA